MGYRVLHKGKILYKDSLFSIYSRGVKLFIEEANCNICKLNLPGSFFKKVLCHTRIMVRLFRFEPRVVIRISEYSFLVSFLGGLYLLSKIDTNWVLSLEHSYRNGMNNPLSLVKLKDITGFSDCIVYGDYWGNPNKEKVGIHRGINSKWSVVFSFKEGSITHIHGIVPDKNRNCVYILTGDEDNESGIWIAKDDFASVQPIITGKQMFRSCVAFPVPNGLLYATDTPLEKNSICLLSLEKDSWGEVHELHSIKGSCIYGTELLIDDKTCYLFATTVEGDSRKKGMSALLSWRRGPGILSNKSECILLREVQKNPEIIASFTKDSWPFIFQFGGITFASGSKEHIYGTPVAVKGFDGKVVEFLLGAEC